VDTILTLPLVVSTYVLHLIWPINLSTMYQTHYVTEAASAEFIIPAAALAIIAGSLIIWRDRISRDVWIALAMIAVPLLPVLDLRQISEEYLVSDRYLFLPAAGWCYLIALGVWKVSYAKKPVRAGKRFAPGLGVLRKWITAAGLLALIAGYTFGSARENSHWADPYSLWSQAARVRPACWQAHYNAGLALIDMKRFPEAREPLERASALAPTEPWIFDALGRVFAATGDRQSAIANFRRSIDLDPEMFESLNNLGTVYFDSGNYQQAEGLFSSALRLRPQAVAARYNLALSYAHQGKFAEAISELQKVVDLTPADTDARFALGLAYEDAGRIPEAITALELGLPMAKSADESRRFSERVDKLRTQSR
jgi:tetratricopeptide (TPR) repeat protein